MDENFSQIFRKKTTNGMRMKASFTELQVELHTVKLMIVLGFIQNTYGGVGRLSSTLKNLLPACYEFI